MPLCGINVAMGNAPANPKIFHITHVYNLRQIIAAGGIWSDAKRLELNLNCQIVGMSKIKQRRLRDVVVQCYPNTHVGDYVPFYFCPRSVMLYILHKGNHPDVQYSGGQGPMIHLQGDMATVVRWAQAGPGPVSPVGLQRLQCGCILRPV